MIQIILTAQLALLRLMEIRMDKTLPPGTLVEIPKNTRLFPTGATRDTDKTKLDYEGFLSPRVLKRYAEYMHECRLRNIPPGQELRSSDNWQKGIPKDAYMKSLLRHVMEIWTGHRGSLPEPGSKVFKDHLCAI